MVFHWSLSDSKSPQISKTRLRILAVLSNAVVWIVSTRPPTSKSSRPFSNPLVIVPNAPLTIGTIITFMFHSFFNSLARLRYLSFFSLSFRFILWSAGTAKSTIIIIIIISHIHIIFIDLYTLSRPKCYIHFLLIVSSSSPHSQYIIIIVIIVIFIHLCQFFAVISLLYYFLSLLSSLFFTSLSLLNFSSSLFFKSMMLYKYQCF